MNRNINETELRELRGLVDEGHICLDEPMSKHTTFRIGGPAEVFMNPTLEELQSVLAFCKEREIPVTIVGNGSNLLVSDDGISGVVIKIGSNMADIEVSGYEIYAEAGAMLAAVARTAEKHNLAGMEFASGIPGSLGGGCIMNAGAYGGELKDILTEITVITKDGEVQTIPAAEAGLEYRHSRFMESGEIVIAAKMLLTDGVEEEIREKSRGFNQSRREKQPLNFPSAGSTFKRPEGNFAGKLIEDSGLKGYQVGGAQVSEKHCGFVVNVDKATAKDVYQLITDVQRIVKEKYDVELQPEVRFLGDF